MLLPGPVRTCAAGVPMNDSPEMPGTAQRYASWAIVLAAVAVVGTAGAPVRTQPTTPLPADARAQLAPGGRLRAALNLGNTLLVSSREPEPAGVAPDLARELARRAGATVTFVGYANAGLVADAARDDAWDVAFIGAEPERADRITFTPAYVEIEATFLVRDDSPLQTVADVDRAGVRVVSAARAAYTLYLQRTLKAATVVEADGLPGAVAVFGRGGLDALAGLTPRLLDDAKTLPGTRLLPGRFTAVQQSMAAPRERAAAFAYLTAFAREVTTSGLLASLIEKHKVRGLSIAK
jgi:polar amino acid transport system substrate-binding protein